MAALRQSTLIFNIRHDPFTVVCQYDSNGHCSHYRLKDRQLERIDEAYFRQEWYINQSIPKIHRYWATFVRPIYEWRFQEALTVVAFNCLLWFEVIYQDQSISAKKRKQWSWYGAIGCGDERGRDLTNNMNLRTCISGINMPASSSSCLSSAAV